MITVVPTSNGSSVKMMVVATSGAELIDEVVAFTACDDFGNIINPMIVEGQVHGGVAQGLGQALLERCVYDPDSGQLLTACMMNYALPRAAHLPPLTSLLTHLTPDPTYAASSETIWASAMAL